MKGLKITAVACSVLTVFSFFAGCQKVENVSSMTDSLIEEVTETFSETETAVNTNTLPVETYPEYPVTYPEIKPADTGVKYQSEDCKYDKFKLDAQLSGFEGTGYITGFSGENQLDFEVNAPTNQHYDLTFCISATSEVL